ncbi:MAG TPA: NADP-dependent oxidoreductase [Steroidobacteraceae bacterium]|jgi:NADPH-dependent curcumin reductase CurA|nr:NADP-dependent oxidoreductase [Steroidobacteraceae bacterium]
MRSKQVHLLERPQGVPSLAQFAIVEAEVAEPAEGEVLVENIYMSVDPAMRPRLAGQTPLNEAMPGGAIGRVLASRLPGFAPGDYVQSMLGFRQYFVAGAKGLSKLDADGMPLDAYMSVLGLTGLTAYGGLLVTASLKDGENVFVSAAAGAVGSVAAQIAKIKGCYVIGSAGSDEKCNWLKQELGLDAVINYKKGELRSALKSAAPRGIDVYFDNVGGEHLNAALPRMNALGRIAVCGMISAYNNFGAISEPVTTLSNMIYNRLTMRGFVFYEFEPLRAQFLTDMKRWLGEGRIRYRSTILSGIEQAPAALIGLFSGANTGKMLVQLAKET